jgi:hypothetical protein
MRALEHLDHDDSVDHGPITFREFLLFQKLVEDTTYPRSLLEHEKEFNQKRGNFAP